jgi:hypothetical protein
MTEVINTGPLTHGTGQKIERLYAWTAIEPDGSEGLIGMALPDGQHIPMIGADKARIESLRGIAERHGRRMGYSVRLTMFSTVTVLETIG